jgi:hypothetical protein
MITKASFPGTPLLLESGPLIADSYLVYTVPPMLILMEIITHKPLSLLPLCISCEDCTEPNLPGSRLPRIILFVHNQTPTAWGSESFKSSLFSVIGRCQTMGKKTE